MMHKFRLTLTDPHTELKNHMPHTAVFLQAPTSGNIVKIGQLYFKVKNVIHIANDDELEPILLVDFMNDQPTF